MATFEQRQAAIKAAAELVRNGPIWVRRANDPNIKLRRRKKPCPHCGRT